MIAASINSRMVETTKDRSQDSFCGGHHVVVVVVVHIYSARLGTPPHGVEKTLLGLKWFTIPPLYLHVTNVSLYRLK